MIEATRRLLVWTLCLGLGATIAGTQPVVAVTVTHTTTAQFDAGSGCYVGERLNGEVVMTPTEGAEFFGGALPSDWSSILWCDFYTPGSGCGPGSITVAGGNVTVQSGRINPFPIVGYGPGISMEAVATFTAEPFEHVGFGSGDHTPPGSIFDDPPIVMFSTGASGTQLFARYGSDFALGASYLGSPHRYRIDWGASTIDFFIDGTLVHSAAASVPGPMTPAASNFRGDPPTVTVDWLRMSPYLDCDYDSSIIDGGNAGADWTTLVDDSTVPAGTTVDFFTRSGNTPSPDGSWTAFTLAPGGAIPSPNRRYLQYRIENRNTDPDETPEVRSVAVSYNACTPSTEVCDNIDNDCDGVVDDGTVGNACTSGSPGVCSPGTTTCNAGVPGCTPIITPGSQTEVCDGDDNDCDGQTDEGTVGNPCVSGLPGICSPGTTTCNAGNPGCAPNITPGSQTETCDGEDDDCDNATDEGTGGDPCIVPLQQGICANSIDVCQGGVLNCPQTVFPGTETCNNLDDDCDGVVNDGDPGSGGACTTPNLGICAPGTLHCVSNSIQCVATFSPQTEVCDGEDDDCDGQTDEGTSGAACPTMLFGVCAAGTLQCQSGDLNCIANQNPTTELCENALDDDCNGSTDEIGCVCSAPNTVTVQGQTRISKVRLKDDPASDKLQTKGTFSLPPMVTIDPVGQDVSVRLSDGNGVVYEGILPAGSFTSNASGSSFKYKDIAAAIDGIKLGKIKIKGDDVTVKYGFKAQGLDQPAFDAGTGSVIIRVGQRCFIDDNDTCTVNSSGSSALCK